MSAPMMASDAANPNFLGAHNPDAALVVKFYSKAVHQPFASTTENRPIYQDVDYIQIFTPGNQLNIVDTPVRQEHKSRFPQQWALYQQGKGDGSTVGTPVNQWPFLSAAQAEEFRGVKFFTVEQLANASDAQLQSLGMIGGMNPMMVRERAKAFLGMAASTAPAAHDAQEKAELKAQVEALNRQVQAMLNAGISPAATPAKRGRKPKAATVSAENVVKDEEITAPTAPSDVAI